MPQESFYTFPARLKRATIFSEDQLLERLDKLGYSVPEERGIFFFPAEISSTRLDAYYTHMALNTLQNFAKESEEGVSFLDSHDADKLGMGHSLTGTLERVSDDVQRVVADFYTLRGIRFGGRHSFESTDDFIAAAQGGIVRDVSVGFYDGSIICDICGQDVWGFTDCPHFPGVEYPVGEQGEETVLATANVDDAHLAEVSSVYDGATPSAMLLKIETQGKRGDIEPRVARILENRYKVHVPQKTIMPVNDKSDSRSVTNLKRKVPKGDNAMDYQATVEKLARVLECESPEVEEKIRGLVNDLDQALAKQDELKSLAEDGRAYRKDVIETALANGRKLFGEDFDEDSYREQWDDKVSVTFVKKVSDDWKRIADAKFPNGRQTQDGESEDDQRDNKPKPVDLNPVPDSAYAAL